ncbi:MAG: hypothetical protein O3A87_02005 [Verrucomicrobia bacterium]|nr:hypothetical protein [Verrucomicrobiota bacterium]MDA1005245.1 hypothetical protein [Verrucomicrobiota bacterium]
MRGILNSILVIATLMVYVVGARNLIEFEHSHQTDSGHGHQHAEPEEVSSHHSHDHHHDSLPPSEDPHDGEHNGDPHDHSHVLAFGSDAPFTSPNLPRMPGASWANEAYSLPDPDRCPEGPYFALIKPPQLG